MSIIDQHLDNGINESAREPSPLPNPFDKPPHLSFQEWFEQLNAERPSLEEIEREKCLAEMQEV